MLDYLFKLNKYKYIHIQYIYIYAQKLNHTKNKLHI